MTSFLMEPVRGSQFGCYHCRFMDTEGVFVVTYPRCYQKRKLTIYECEHPGIWLPDWTNFWPHIYGPEHMYFWRSSVLAIVSGMPDGLLWSSWIPWKLHPNSLFQPWGLGSYFQSGRQVHERELCSLSAFPRRMPLACQVGQVFAPDRAISLLSTLNRFHVSSLEHYSLVSPNTGPLKRNFSFFF